MKSISFGSFASGLGLALVCLFAASTASAVPPCGNGIKQGLEQCDDGNNSDGDGCDASCHLEYCGDGKTQPALGEQCDDGNNVDGDGCDSACKTEEADSPEGTLTMTPVTEKVAEAPAPAPVYRIAETAREIEYVMPYCGDGTLQRDRGEQCDDGNKDDGDGCDSQCRIVFRFRNLIPQIERIRIK